MYYSRVRDINSVAEPVVVVYGGSFPSFGVGSERSSPVPSSCFIVGAGLGPFPIRPTQQVRYQYPFLVMAGAAGIAYLGLSGDQQIQLLCRTVR